LKKSKSKTETELERLTAKNKLLLAACKKNLRDLQQETIDLSKIIASSDMVHCILIEKLKNLELYEQKLRIREVDILQNMYQQMYNQISNHIKNSLKEEMNRVFLGYKVKLILQDYEHE
jgi:hypothetical protein